MATQRKTPRMVTSMPGLDWVPRRTGRIFCSPACGAECQYSEWELAHKRAKALCKRLGAGWEPRVWENGGWHYMVFLGKQPEDYHCAGVLEVYPSHATSGFASYWAALQTEPQLVSSGSDFENPEDAIRNVLQRAEGIAVQWLAVMSEVRSDLTKGE